MTRRAPVRLRLAGLCLAVLGFVGLLTAATVPAALAQDSQRVIQGRVVDAGDQGLQGAVVYLKDLKTLGVKSFISTQDGSYRFGQLGSNSDYELWAELKGRKSSTKTISSFDQKKVFTITLRIDTR